MVMARLHLICGNCGCSDEWEWEHKAQEKIDDEIVQNEDVSLWCKNCSTLHSLNDDADRINNND